MEQWPDLTNLSLFVKVVEMGSFSSVCKATRIPKASLSRRIATLESHFNAQLLVRNTRRLQLTEIGQEVLSRAHSLLALAEETEALIARTKERPHGKLRITAGVEYGVSVISPLVCRYLDKFPDVDVELDLTGRRVDLIEENFDLGVRIGPLADSTMSLRKIGSFRYGLFASPKLFRRKKLTSIQQLSAWPALTFSRAGQTSAWTLVKNLEVHRLEVRPRLTSNNYWVLLEAACRAQGIVFMPIFLAAPDVERGRLQRLLPSWTSEEIPIHFLYPSQRYLTSKVRSFIDFAMSEIKK